MVTNPAATPAIEFPARSAADHDDGSARQVGFELAWLDESAECQQLAEVGVGKTTVRSWLAATDMI
jgi:hypothetical protein